jgi:hypothetical protein
VRIVKVRDQYGNPELSGWKVFKRFPTRRKACQHRAGLKAKPATVATAAKKPLGRGSDTISQNNPPRGQDLHRDDTMKRYEVIDHNCGGVNIWTEWTDKGVKPLTFASVEEAQKEIDDYRQDRIEAYLAGYLDYDDDIQAMEDIEYLAGMLEVREVVVED